MSRIAFHRPLLLPAIAVRGKRDDRTSVGIAHLALPEARCCVAPDNFTPGW
jgi:hypothetical protein